MKQIFYGPTGCGKSHIILHNLPKRKKVVIITTNGLTMEFRTVGLYTPIIEIPIFAKITEDGSGTHFSVDNSFVLNTEFHSMIGFDLYRIPCLNRSFAMQAVIKWLEAAGVANDPEYTIVFINIYEHINNPEFVQVIEKWSADIIVEHTCDKRSVEFYTELEYITMSPEWFLIPVLIRHDENNICGGKNNGKK